MTSEGFDSLWPLAILAALLFFGFLLFFFAVEARSGKWRKKGEKP